MSSVVPVYSVTYRNMHTNIDGIILGASKLNHLVANMNACEEGPLDERKFDLFIS